jgi:hypothetical protein
MDGPTAGEREEWSSLEFLDGDSHRVHYMRQPVQREPDFGVTSVNYDFAELLARAEAPS